LADKLLAREEDAELRLLLAANWEAYLWEER
jgi:hypothetical protein